MNRTLKRVLACVAVVAVLAGAALAGYSYWTSRKVAGAIGEVDRIPGVFDGLDESDRPGTGRPLGSGKDPHQGSAFTVLLVGSDVRSDEPTTGTAATAAASDQRSDVLMLVTVSADREHGAVVSIPRDSWVPVPGRGHAKINAALAWGGPSLLVRTVEDLTGVRVDHYATVDFAGFANLVDTLGGVSVKVRQNSSYGGYTFTKGKQRLDGKAALAFVRQRKNLPRGDLDRVINQQRLLSAAVDQIVSKRVAADPALLERVIGAVAASVSIDDTLTDEALHGMFESLAGMDRKAMRYGTAPFGGFGTEAGQSVVYLHPQRSARLWAQLRSGDLTHLELRARG